MFTKKLRIFSLCIVMLMTASLFIGCEEEVDSQISSAEVVSTISETPTRTISIVSTDNLGSHDLGGIKLTIGAISRKFLFPELYESSDPKEETDVAIDQHKTEIVQSIAKRFNCVLEPVDLNYGKYSEEVLPNLLAGELVAHIIMPVIWEAGLLVQANVCMDLNTPVISKYINFNNPWWILQWLMLQQ